MTLPGPSPSSVLLLAARRSLSRVWQQSQQTQNFAGKPSLFLSADDGKLTHLRRWHLFFLVYTFALVYEVLRSLPESEKRSRARAFSLFHFPSFLRL